MIDDTIAPRPELMAGIRLLADLEGVEMLGEPLYLKEENSWLLTIQLETKTPSTYIPPKTTWCILVDRSYPLGHLRFYPAKKGGVEATFPHQARNEQGSRDVPWRTGKLCLDSPALRVAFWGQVLDPVGDAETRLRWHTVRALIWLSAASSNNLVLEGDPFELPQYPSTTSKLRIVHNEGTETYVAWCGRNTSLGFAVFDDYQGLADTLLAVAFEEASGELIHTSPYYSKDRHGINCKDRRKGIWWRWREPIVHDPWEVPATWGQLRRNGRKSAVDVDGELRKIARRMRGREASILMLGYPIPKIQGEAPQEMHWQAVLLPKFDNAGNIPDGYRPNEIGLWQRDRNTLLSNETPINYVTTENWHPDRLQARGRLSESMRKLQVAVVGVGALGSVLVELLVRSGVNSAMLIDPEPLVAGNVVRHVLSFQDIGKPKASAMRDRLTSLSPFSSIDARSHELPSERTELEELLANIDLIVDCTASDAVIAALSLGWWPLPKYFVSLSLGFEGKRLFAFISRGNAFPSFEFRESIEPWLVTEKRAWAEYGELLEGAGCWSPMFPARYDDILLAASTAVKLIESSVKGPLATPRLVVYEQCWEDEAFVGYRLADRPAELDTT